jgi:hypothetical protein
VAAVVGVTRLSWLQKPLTGPLEPLVRKPLHSKPISHLSLPPALQRVVDLLSSQRRSLVAIS